MVTVCLRPPTLCPASALPKPLESAITKNVPVNPLESALTKSLDLNPREMNSYKKAGGSPPLLASNLPLSIGIHRCSSGITPFALCRAGVLDREGKSLLYMPVCQSVAISPCIFPKGVFRTEDSCQPKGGSGLSCWLARGRC